jgi:O-antigen/teichoic acid export membrane protein
MNKTPSPKYIPAKSEPLSGLVSGKSVHSTPLGFLVIRKQFLHCAIAGLSNLAGSQILRLVGNLILTRLLFPELFGLMAITNVFLMALALLSDLGIGTSIVQRHIPPRPRFLRTAWTLQLIRAGALWLITSAMAWPLAIFYNEPRLVWLLPVIAFTQVIAGFESIAVHVCARELKHGVLAMLDLATAFVGTLAAILIAWQWPSVWALVFGGMISAVFRTILTYFLPCQIRHRFRLNREACREMIHFGKWLILASGFTFVASEGDRLILGKFLTLTELGIYTVAFFFAQSAVMLARGLALRTLFPVLSRLKAEGDAVRRKEYFRYHQLFLAGSFLPVAVFLLAGPLIIDLLYDDRYKSAGPLLQILSVGAAGAILRALAGPVVLAQGDSFGRMMMNGMEAFILVVCMLVGGLIWGLYGFTGGFVVAQYLAYLPCIPYLKKYGVWSPKVDTIFLAVTTLLGALGVAFWWERF